MVVSDSSDYWGPSEKIQESISLADNLWLPDIEIWNLKNVESLEVLRSVGGVVIYKNKTIMYSKKY